MDEKYVMMATNFQEFKNIWCKSLSKVYLIRFMQTLNAYLDDSMQHLLDSRFLHSTHYKTVFESTMQ